MSSPATGFEPDRYRGYLLVIVRRNWSAALQSYGEPEDVVQLAIIEAIRCGDQFRGQTAEEYRGWLGTVLTNTIKDIEKQQLRKKRDYRRIGPIEDDVGRSSDALCRFAAAGPSPSSGAAQEEALLRLADALAGLPLDQFLAVSLHHLDGLTLKETAERTGRTKAAVAGHLRRAMETLRAVLGGGP
jgi:RNA polymerase sigma-70 factor (ECF subfamily)